ncbi:unnamed protein product [Rangifer tarandus platyrhynchus]|uniref:Uncharacterized protein n=2 Tax=Rangifer tarandus platyrhynchus TaxID=3082113 RepID=A0AC59ZM61_RANTA|nr:unnamed protein product [Rangifer tarandus platyrhynchus]
MPTSFILKTCEHITFPNQRDFTDVIKVKCLGLSRWALSKHINSLKNREPFQAMSRERERDDNRTRVWEKCDITGFEHGERGQYPNHGMWAASRSCLACLVALTVKKLSAMQETQVESLVRNILWRRK